MIRNDASGKVYRFEHYISPHLDAAYNLARWILKDATSAQDVVQESASRAFSSIDRFDGQSSKAWFLTIVRNECFSWLKKSAHKHFVDIDLETTMTEQDQDMLSHTLTPEVLMMKVQSQEALQRGLESLPVIYREVIVLKELEALAYKEIAAVTGVPMGTVMSRLARARDLLKKELLQNDS